MAEDNNIAVQRYRHFRINQLTQLFFATLMVTLPFFLAPAYPGEDRVALGSWRIPPVCPHRVLYDGSCPGCGLIRSFTALAHGQFKESFAYHHLGIPLFMLVALQIPLRLYLLKTGPDGMSPAVFKILYRPVPFLVALLIINWLIGEFLRPWI